MVTAKSIATLVIFVVSIIFVIHPLSIPIYVPRVGRKRIPINLMTAPIIAIAVLWAAQCLGPTQIRNGIVGTEGIKPYNILILFFTLAYMAITLDITGVLQSAAFWVSNRGGDNGWKLYFYFYVMLTVLSVILGNDPVILSGTAFLVYYTKVAELNPISWLISEFAAANTASMVLFVGNPTNVVICEGFRVNNAAFTAYTIFPFLACSLFCFIALAFQFRDGIYIPRKLPVTGYLDVRSVLLDPRGALIGSILLGTCLVVIIIVSFVHVDVWMISLPFAVVKFIFDIAWDHYRHVKGISMLGRSPKRNPSEGDVPAPGHHRTSDEITFHQLSRHFTPASPRRRQATLPPELPTIPDDDISLPMHQHVHLPRTESPLPIEQVIVDNDSKASSLSNCVQEYYQTTFDKLSDHFPTIFTALPRLPFALVPFAFSQFILIEALQHQGWIDIFASWFVKATSRRMYPTIWFMGVLGVILCNLSGTNIGATILLTKVARTAQLPQQSDRAAAIALAVASNIGAVSFTFSASLAGLLWRGILKQKGIFVTQRTFAFWNLLPLLVMTGTGLAIVCAEMAVLY